MTPVVISCPKHELGQTLGVIELNEQTIIDQLVQRLGQNFPAIPPDTVAAVVKDIYAGFDGRPLREYVPLFVERRARGELKQLLG